MLAVLSISLGAAFGALARWQLGLLLNPGGLMPWGTVAANLLGGYLIGLLMSVLQALPELNPLWKLGLITGFLGALTTFSTFSDEVVTEFLAQRHGLAMGMALVHVLGSFFMTYLGMRSAAAVMWMLPTGR